MFFITTELYKKSPFIVITDSSNVLRRSRYFVLKIKNNKSFIIANNEENIDSGDEFQFDQKFNYKGSVG